ncbi:lipopolysaccharide heptosyltransferase I [Terriglobus roseus DSM 18391]|uniref:Lipopolysaccharide heptosyltransferase 1 n=1 Tax=Terriglobus roseus (strain DSM 18391 / NRRL B-41598 / KBS 63) TaxID=926566 RepID=I3ZLT1_TERRK|nr:lipopolysaccharide heptosyltransferase I [Terriglobus roseus]AFL90199.1 lipopolysaccharide heptosyltransferase I [Terriglobus roseus DSM 18391]
MTEKLRILIVRVGAMGDVLHAMPAVAALRKAAPDAEIAWAIEPKWSSLLRSSEDAVPRSAAMPLVDRVHFVPTKTWSKKPFSIATFRSILALRRELRAQHYDIAIDLQGSIRSSVIARMSGARRVVGSATTRESQARWLYSQSVGLQRAHVVEQAAEIVSAVMGLTIQSAVVDLPIDPQAEQWCEALLLDRPSGPLVILAPTAGWGAKEWPAERYGAVAKALAARGCTVLVNASPFDVDAVASSVVSFSNGAASAVPCTLPQLTALLRRASLLIAGDSGPLHLAAALAVPVVSIFGPTDPVRTGPWGSHARVLRHATSITDHRRHREPEAGLLQISVDEVIKAAVGLMPPAHG